MTLEIALLFIIIIGMIVAMASEKLSVDTIAFIIMVLLILGGFVSPAEGIAGLSNEATVTILSLMILTVGLETTGVVTSVGKRLKKLLDQKEKKTLAYLMAVSGSFSAFVSSTAIVIVFMRILVKFSKDIPTNLSRLLLPLSFACILGGSCTLLGTSTNLIVSSLAKDAGLKAFGVFEFTHIGVVFFATGIIYMVIFGRHMIPNRKRKSIELTEEYEIQDYLTEVQIASDSNLIGKRVDQTPLFKEEDLDLVEILRDGIRLFPNESEILFEGDILLVKGSVEKITSLRRRSDLLLVVKQSDMDDERMNTREMKLCEVIVKPNSRLIGKSLDKVTLKREYDAIPLAVKKNRKYYPSEFEELQIEAWDTVLMEVGLANFKQFYNLSEFIVLQEFEEYALKTDKRYLAAGIVAVVIALAAFNVVSILVSALSGCVAMFLTGCLDLQRAYRRVDWSVYFLIAGVIPLGTAMENTGASQLIAETFINFFEDASPRILVAALYGVTTLLSSVLSNNATAILFAPIAISIGQHLGIDARPLLLTIMFAANMSFMSPIGYQTNTLVYGVGEYRFIDFFKVGGVLSLLIWVLSVLLIPWYYF